MLTLALSKGRILKDTIPLLEKSGVHLLEDPGASRKLIFPTNRDDVRIMILRATDVPEYLRHGAADLGVAGKDVLMEQGMQGLYEPLDLGIARCRLMTASLKGAAPIPLGRPVRVASKYVNVARRFYTDRGRQVEIIKLYGAMELAPLVGLADRIVDVVDTGGTLRANGLEARSHIADISSRLVVSQSALKTKYRLVQPLIDRLQAIVAEQGERA
jgi:ATP phosphoribosyltransferase